ncbi:hypothetical protein Tco_1182128 [Tanacetum coccineum]
MATMAENVIATGAKNRPPMLEKGMYDSYYRSSVNVAADEKRAQTVEDLSPKENLQYDSDIKLSIYFFLDYHYEPPVVPQQQTALPTQPDSGFVVQSFLPTDDPIGYAVNAGKSQATGTRVINTVGEENANQPRETRLEEMDSDCDDLQLHTTSNFKADHVDAYDSDYDDKATTCAIFMASLSPASLLNGDRVTLTYNSDILSEVPNYDNYHDNNVLNYVFQEMEYIEHLVSNNDSHDELTSDSNVISYVDYIVTIENNATQYVPRPALDNAMILFVIGQMKSQVEKCNTVNQKTKSVNESLTSELELYKEKELLEEIRALKLLDEHIGFASKFAERIRDLLVKSKLYRCKRIKDYEQYKEQYDSTIIQQKQQE